MRDTAIAAWNRLKAILHRRRLERELDEEVAFHLAMREADLARDGLAPGPARDAARRRFGNVTHVKEQTHDMWTFGSFESLCQDARFASRTLRKSPGFAVGRHCGPRRRHRRQHRHLQHGGRHADAGHALRALGSARRALGQCRAREARTARRVVSRFPRLARAVEELRRHGGVRRRDADPHRQRRARAHPGRVRLRAVLLAAWRVARARPNLSPGRRRCGQACTGRDSQ